MILIIYLDLLDNTFIECNYKDYQPFIKIFGKNIFEWILDYLRIDIFNHCIILYNNKLYDDYILNFNKYNIDFTYKYINEKSNVINVLLEIFEDNKYNIDSSLLYIDTKNFYTKNTFFLKEQNTIFYKNDDIGENLINKKIYLNHQNNIVTDILSNDKKTKNLVIGSFIFNSLFVFKKYCEKVNTFNNLFFINNISIINLINLMLHEKIIFNSYELTNNDIISLETPFHIRLFCNNFPKISALNNDIMIPNKKICINLNCIFKIINKNLLNYQPIYKNIIFIKYLKNIGNTIIITTTLEDTESNKKYIIEILNQNNILYDEIYYNLPESDFYIDINNILLDNNIEKNLGFYKNKIESRDFNDVICKDIKTYKKISNDLSGEIYYYKNIPTEIKDIFPIMFNFDIDNKWYEMENINGIPISKLYLNEELTLEQFNHVLKTINRIHSCKIDIEDLFSDISSLNIYENYTNKIKNRYKTYDYSKFNNSEIIYNYLIKELDIYEKKNLGKISIIHGDTVFTNILINNFGKIKLIDMRGIINKTLTIYGDKMYDYAKIYQSLLGYDEILDNKYVSVDYKNMFLNYFEERFLNIYSENDFYYLKIITASLLFTLIPLHNNDKCKDYYNLIHKLKLKYN